MNARNWRKAAAAVAASLALATPADAFLLFGGAPASVTAAVEYHNAALGEYLVTVTPAEIAALDGGSAPGWVRTRFAFFTVDVPASARVANPRHAAAAAVCRYFVPPASHFLSASADECAAVGQRVPGAVLESDAVFYAWLPDDAGRCPRLFAKIGGFSFVPVYRLQDVSHGNAHRFTTSKAERDAMVAEGWLSIGCGGDGVAMCVPSWGDG